MDGEIKEMRFKVNALGHRLAQCEEDLRERGVFSDVYAARVGRFRDAHTRLVDRMAKTPRLHWLGIKDEVARDYNALADDFDRLIKQLDADRMKSASK